MKKRRKITVPISSLCLDLKNPRHESATNERAALTKLVTEENVIALAKDIAARGELSPIDGIGVLPHPKEPRLYVVAEGNRRVAALKLLRDPEVSPNDLCKVAIRRALSKGTAPPGRVEVTEFRDEEDAHTWKSLRHEGEQRGVGTKQWNAKQKTRHATGAGRKDPNRLAQALLDYAQARGLVTAEQRDAVPFTTITRYLTSPVVRHVLGVEDGDDELRITFAQDEFDVAAKRFVLDSIGPKASVNSRTKAKQREAYVHALEREGIAPKTRLPDSVRPVAAKTAPAKTRFAPTPKSPGDRDTIPPPEFRPTIVDNRLRYLLKELHNIDPVAFPFASAYLYRAFLEHSVVRQAEKRGHVRATNEKLHNTMLALHTLLLADAGLVAKHGSALKNRLKPFQLAASQTNNHNNPEVLGAQVHGAVLPTRAGLVSCWDGLDFAWPLLCDGL
jgi:hypothetical protein